MIRRFVVMTLVAALAAACATTPDPKTAADGDPREKDPKFRYGVNPGPSPVGAIPDVIIKDDARNRDVKITIDYPTRAANNPLVVFSHAVGGSNRSYAGLASHWASFGYVVIRVQHGDNDVKADDLTPAQWRDRVRDVTFVLDSLTSLAERYPELQGKIDANRVAAAGHSRGAMTAMLLGGMRTFPGAVSYADPRVKAVVAMSPVGPHERWGVTTESFADIRVPALFMTGTRDTGASESETPEWRQQAFELSPAGDKWLVTVDNVAHATFTGVSGAVIEDARYEGPINVDPALDPQEARRRVTQSQADRQRRLGLGQRALFGRVRAYALAFLDAYLKDDAGGRDYLRQADERSNVIVKSK